MSPSSVRSVCKLAPNVQTSFGAARPAPAASCSTSLGLQTVKLRAQRVALGLGLAELSPVPRRFARQELTGGLVALVA